MGKQGSVNGFSVKQFSGHSVEFWEWPLEVITNIVFDRTSDMHTVNSVFDSTLPAYILLQDQFVP